MYFLLKIVSYLLQLIPRKVALFFGRQLGSFIYYFIPFRKSIATKNLEIAFPDWDCNKKKKTLHACYRHFGMVFIDFFRLPKIFDNIDKSIVSINENSLRLFKHIFGGIMLSAHFGNWEFLGPTLGVNNINLVGVTQIQHNNGANLLAISIAIGVLVTQSIKQSNSKFCISLKCLISVAPFKTNKSMLSLFLLTYT